MNAFSSNAFSETNEYLDQNTSINLILRELDRPKYLIVTLYDFITWKSFYYPFILLGLVNAIYLIIWYTNLSNLTLASLILLFVVLLDAASSIITNNYYKNQPWGEEKQQKLVAFANGLYESYNFFISYYKFLINLRKKSPYLLAIFIVIKFTIAFLIGSYNNFLLCYIKTSILVLVPGLCHRNIFNKLIGLIKRSE